MYSGLIAFIQNFTPVVRPLDLFYHIIVVLPVLVVPLLFALVPLLKASSTTVQNALCHVFATPYKSIFNFTQALFTNTKIKYSMNNLFRSNQRTSLLIILLIAGISLYTTGSNLEHSLKTDFANYAANSGYGITVILKDSTTQDLSFVNELPFVDGASAVSRKAIRYKSTNKSYEENSFMRTYPPGYTFDARRIVSGELKKDCNECIYISQRIQDDFTGVVLGDKIDLTFRDSNIKETYIFSGIMRDITQLGFYKFGTVPNSAFNEIGIKIKEGFSSTEASGLLDNAFLDHGIDVSQVSDTNVTLLALDNHLKPMYVVIQVAGIFTIIIAITGLFIVMNLSIQERAREMGIMKAVGETAGSIVNMYHREYIVITLIALAAGSVIGYGFNAAICNLFGVMVVNAPVPPLNNFKYLAIASIAILGLQTVLISVYVRYKITKTSSRLLNEVF